MTISYNDIIAQGALAPEHRDTLHVHWSLLHSCNYQCSYCYQPKVEENCVFVKDRILSMAHRLLEQPRPYYAFTITGGEPTLHPHLPEILAYLYTSGRKVGVVVETNGSRDIQYFQQLLQRVPDHALQFQISVHPAYADLAQILTLTATIAEARQLAHVRIMCDPELQESVRLFHDKLTQLRAIIPFTMAMQPVMQPSNMNEPDTRYNDADFRWWKEAKQLFAAAVAAGPAAYPELPFTAPQFHLRQGRGIRTLGQNSVRPNTWFKDFHCCTGSNLVRVDADGHFYGTMCDITADNPPLWRAEKKAVAGIARIVRCRREHCSGGLNEVLPKFRELEDAKTHMAELEERALVFADEVAPLRNPVTTELDTEQIVRMRLKRMKPIPQAEGEERSVIIPNPDFARKRMGDICKLYDALADTESRDAFLRGIKAIVTGDTDYLTDAGYARFEHPEVKEEAGEIYFSKPGIFCTCIRLDTDDKGDAAAMAEASNTGNADERLRAMRGTIRQHMPKLQIALSHQQPDSYLDAPLWLLEQFPKYTLYMGHHTPWNEESLLYALPPERPRRPLPIPESFPRPLVSIIVPTHNNEDTLKRCLDSALIQGVEGMELIVIDDASTDSTPEIIAEYVRRYPKIVRTIRFAENKGPGPARNAGMDMAMGKYMAFIDSDDMLAHDFMKRGVEVMEQEDADIVAFDLTIVQIDKKEVLFGVEAGTYQGEESLHQFLLEKAGHYAPYARMYRASFVRKQSIQFTDNIKYEDISFGINTFYHASKSIVLPEVGYHKYLRNNSKSMKTHGDHDFTAFIEFAKVIAELFEDSGLDVESEMYLHCVRKIYRSNRDKIFDAVSKAEKENRLEKLLTEERLLQLGCSKEALCCIIVDYAILHCHRKELNLKVAPEDLDWKAAAAAPCPSKTYTAYGNADNTTRPAPLLSVIVPNYNKEKYLQKCLESIFAQSMQDFELIIVDDASTDSSYDMLSDYADAYPYIRLYRMDRNVRQGTCRNIGMDKARGKYIIFVDSDDLCLPGYFATATESIAIEQADVVIFSSQKMNKNGEIFWVNNVPQLNITGRQAVLKYLEGAFEPAPWAKIFNIESLRQNNCFFPRHICGAEDVIFFSNTLLKFTRCVSKDIIVYTNCEAYNSSIKPSSSNYIQLHSAYIFYWEFQKLILHLFEFEKEKIYTKIGDKRIKWHMENLFLRPCAAFWQTTEATPMTNKDYMLLRDCTLFLWSLLIGYARCHAQSPIQEGLLTIAHKHITTNHTQSHVVQPLVSVIIPTYNQEACIACCLESILTQSLRNLEVIIINDASTDNTLVLCEDYASKDSRVRVYSNEKNMGQGYSRNLALEISCGKYITYVDSDDYILPHLALHGVAILEHNFYIDFIHYCVRFDPDGKPVPWACEKPGLISGREMLERYCKGRSSSLEVWGKVYRKSFIDGIKSPEHLFEDSIFLLHTYAKAQYILLENMPAYVVVPTPHESSTVRPLRYTPKHTQGNFALCRGISEFFALNPEIDLTKTFAHSRILHRYESYAKKDLLAYIASFQGKAISPLSNSDLDNLKHSPEFLRIILDDYAKLYAQHTNYSPALPTEDMDPLYICHEPADYLIPIPSNTENFAPVILTVIILVYNTTHYLERCLNSVIEQHMEGVEIILVGDCPQNEDILAICEKYAHRHKFIKLFRTPWNSTQSTIRSQAIMYSCGKYITFVDSDDWLAPGFFLHFIKDIEQYRESDFIEFSWCAWDNISNKIIHYAAMPDGLYIDGMSALTHYIHNNYNNRAVWAKIYRRNFLIEKGIFSVATTYEDEHFLLKANLMANQIMFRDICAYYHAKNVHISTDATCLQFKRKRKFESTLNALNFTHELLLACFGEDSATYKRAITEFNHAKHHQNNFLYYIYTCNKLGLPSPLTEVILEKITTVKEFLRNIIMDYAVLSQKVLPKAKG